MFNGASELNNFMKKLKNLFGIFFLSLCFLIASCAKQSGDGDPLSSMLAENASDSDSSSKPSTVKHSEAKKSDSLVSVDNGSSGKGKSTADKLGIIRFKGMTGKSKLPLKKQKSSNSFFANLSNAFKKSFQQGKTLQADNSKSLKKVDNKNLVDKKSEVWQKIGKISSDTFDVIENYLFPKDASNFVDTPEYKADEAGVYHNLHVVVLRVPDSDNLGTINDQVVVKQKKIKEDIERTIPAVVAAHEPVNTDFNFDFETGVTKDSKKSASALDLKKNPSSGNSKTKDSKLSGVLESPKGKTGSLVNGSKGKNDKKVVSTWQNDAEKQREHEALVKKEADAVYKSYIVNLRYSPKSNSMSDLKVHFSLTKLHTQLLTDLLSTDNTKKRIIYIVYRNLANNYNDESSYKSQLYLTTYLNNIRRFFMVNGDLKMFVQEVQLSNAPVNQVLIVSKPVSDAQFKKLRKPYNFYNAPKVKIDHWLSSTSEEERHRASQEKELFEKRKTKQQGMFEAVTSNKKEDEES